jgi:hypothetical protein
MMIFRLRASLLLALVLPSLLLAGCGTPTQEVGNKPEDKLNPALTSHQKAILAARQNNN